MGGGGGVAGSPWSPGAECRGQKGGGCAGPQDSALWHGAYWVWAMAQEVVRLDLVKAKEDRSPLGRARECEHPAETGNQDPSPRIGEQSAAPQKEERLTAPDRM